MKEKDLVFVPKIYNNVYQKWTLHKSGPCSRHAGIDENTSRNEEEK